MTKATTYPARWWSFYFNTKEGAERFARALRAPSDLDRRHYELAVDAKKYYSWGSFARRRGSVVESDCGLRYAMSAARRSSTFWSVCQEHEVIS